MIDMTLPALTKPELEDFVLTRKQRGARESVPTAVEPRLTRMSSLSTLLEKLNGFEEIFHDARRAAVEANQQQEEFQRRAEAAEAEKARLESELTQLKGQMESLERVPRWVKKLFGASQF